MPVYFYNGLPLIRDGAVAVDEACCCGEPLCDCPCCPDENFGGFKITIIANEPAGGFAEPCCEDVGGVYFALITQENPTACEGRTFVTLGCGELEVTWNIGCGGTVKTLNVGVILRSGLGTAEAQVNNQVALADPCSDLNFTGLQDTLTFPGVGDCAELTIAAEALPCGVSGDGPGDDDDPGNGDPPLDPDPDPPPPPPDDDDEDDPPDPGPGPGPAPGPAPLAKKRTKPNRRRKARKQRQSLPICQHRGELLGVGYCSCGARPNVHQCTLLDRPCIPRSSGKPIARLTDGTRIDSPTCCNVCPHHTGIGG